MSHDKYNYFKLLMFNNYSFVLKQPYLRTSFQKSGQKVSQIIAETLPNTAVLAVAAISLAFILGIILGVISAVFKDTILDRVIAVFSTLGMSVPSFFSAILFAWLFGFVWHQFTHLQMTGSLYEVDDLGRGIYIQWKNLILPAIVLGIRPLAAISQLTRSALLEELNKDYIKTAKAKGLSPYKTRFKKRFKSSCNSHFRLVCIAFSRSSFCGIYF